MNNKAFKKIATVCTLTLALFGIGLPGANAATEEEIEGAIVDGLEWLATQQLDDGSWDYYPVSTTGLAVLKFVDRAKELGKDPFDAADYEYANNVIGGLDFIFGQAISDVNGVHFSDYGLQVYSTGIAMMAVAATNQPTRVITTGVLTAQTYAVALQRMMDWMVWAQNDSGCGVGGWGYGPNDPSWADNSNSSYATLGIGFANIPSPKGFGIPIPAGVLTGLDTFITNFQRVGGPYDGGSVYNPCYAAWVNTLKTGNLLYQMALTGRIEDNPTVQRAIGFIERYWAAPAGVCDGCGWLGDYQAMFAMMKGLEAYGIEELTVGGSPIDWFDQVSTYIVNNQSDDGSWTHTTGEGTPTVIDTAWALLTLERVVEKIEFGIPSQCVASGQAFTPFDADTYVVIGTPPYTWTWTGEVNLDVSKDDENVFSITYDTGWTGSETITFTATDANGKTSDDDATFTVDPVPVVGDILDQTTPFFPFNLDDYLSGIDPSQVTWSFAGNSCLQVFIDGDNVVTVTNPGGCTEPETITFTATATACGEAVSDSDAATFTPNRPPVCDKAYADPGRLWPPNHQFVPISIMGVTDPDGDTVTFTIDSIYQDEPVDTNGDGSFTPDGMGVDMDTAYVRAERAGTKKVPGDGRVYHIGFTAADGKGGSCTGEVLVGVPHDVKDTPVDGGTLYDSTVTP